MTGPTLVNEPARTRLVVTLPAVHRCPHVDEVDEGELTIIFRVDERTIELHSLRAWIDSLSDWVVSHESFTEHIREALTRMGIDVERVSSSWTTAGMAVQVSA